MARALLIIVLVIIAAALFMGYRWGSARDTVQSADQPVGTSGAVAVDEAREAGARVGERVATGVNQAQRATADAALTAKIKSKMALDDTVEALDIDVDTSAGVVTLSGEVNTEAERAKALALARETEGVVDVVDKLVVAQR